MEPSPDQTRILIISHDVVDTRMAGPGIRYHHLARVLARELQVTLAVPTATALEFPEEITVLSYHSGQEPDLEQAIRQAQVILVSAVMLSRIPALSQPTAPLVIDGYDPCLAETLSLQEDKPTAELQSALTQAYLLGDYFICASERQRDWWLGLLEANGRVNAHTFGGDPSMRSLVDVVPFGLPSELAQHTARMVRGVWPGIEEGDRIIIWGGGLWPWLDPLTAIRAIDQVGQHRSDVRLIFPGTRHPNPGMADISTHNEAALQIAQDLGLLNKTVFFGDWVPYADWPSVLLESDLALTLHYDTLETRLAFRSRVLDYIWAGLPIVATRGDATSDLVARYGLGAVVDYQDVDGVCKAIIDLLQTPGEPFAERFTHARQALTWEQAAQPLMAFCRHPRHAPDKTDMNESLGNPYYTHKIEHLQKLVDGYERGRFIRLMRWLNHWRKKIGRGK